MSEWKSIEGFPEYSVSDLGEIRRDDYDRMVKTRQNKQGVLMVSLYTKGKMKTKGVALIVANAFLDPPRNEFYDSVINLNGDRSDCRAVNLMRRPRPFTVRYFKMFDDQPYRSTIYVPEINGYFQSIRQFCVMYGLIEGDVVSDMWSQRRVFHYGWMVFKDRADHESYELEMEQKKQDEREREYKTGRFNRFM